jgi:hypothetical protein
MGCMQLPASVPACRGKAAFILPWTLIIATLSLAIAGSTARLLLQNLRHVQTRNLTERTEQLLRWQVQSLVEQLPKVLAEGSSLLSRMDGADTFQQHCLLQDEADSRPLCSSRHDGPPIEFPSVLAGASLRAGWESLPSPKGFDHIDRAWSFEDAGLAAPMERPPLPFPFPVNGVAPVLPPAPVDPGTLPQYIFSPSEDIPFLPRLSPAAVPVVRLLTLRAGFFATGPPRSREKTVRIRYYLEGELWNPYNRTLRLHPGSGLRRIAELSISKLPSVRIHNVSRGLSSGWRRLDEISNQSSGKRGISAYLELPPQLGPGETIRFIEPHPHDQPEGLARTLLSGFPVTGWDRINIEWKSPETALHFEIISEGVPWFTADVPHPEYPRLEYSSAAYAEVPFLISSGSLSFRYTDTRFALSMAHKGPLAKKHLDPRRSHLSPSRPLHIDTGRRIPFDEAIECVLTEATASSVPEPLTIAQEEPLFSWPHSTPDSLFESLDLPLPDPLYSLGTRRGRHLNQLIDEVAFGEAMEEPTRVVLAGDEARLFAPSLPLNTAVAAHWDAFLRRTTSTVSTNRSLPRFVHARAHEPEDWIHFNAGVWDTLCTYLADQAENDPVATAGDWFSKGTFLNALREATGTPVPERIASAVLLRHPGLIARCSATWYLHLAVRTQAGRHQIVRQARIALLYSHSPEGNPEVRILHFQWVSPQS